MERPVAASSQRWAAAGPALLVLLAGLGVMAAIGNLVRTRDLAQQEAALTTRLQAARVQLTALTEGSLAGSAGLETLLRVQGRLDERSFRAVAEPWLREHPAVRFIALAPGDVVAQLLPAQGAEGLAGQALRSDAAAAEQLRVARVEGAAQIFAPYPLPDGRPGVVQRRPVFLPDGPRGPLSYWGSINTALDLERLAERAGLSAPDLRVALHAPAAQGRLGPRLWGDATLGSSRHLHDELRLSGATWVVLVAPRAGWGWAAWRGPWLWATSSAIALLTAMTWALSRRRLSLQAEATARRDSEREARETSARLQALLNTASDWYWEQDADLRMSYISDPRGRQLVAALHAAIGHRRWEHPLLVPGHPGEAAWAAHREQLQRHEPFRDFEYAVTTGSGGMRWISVSGDPVFDEQGGFCGYRGTGRDVSALRDTEQRLLDSARQLNQARSALHESASKLQAVFDSADPIAIIVLDLNGRIQSLNSGGVRLLGIDPAQAIGRSMLDHYLPEELAAEGARFGKPADAVLPRQAAGKDGGHTRVWTLRDLAGGRTARVSHTATMLRDAQGQHTGYLVIARDLTEQEMAQHALQTEQALVASVLAAPVQTAIIAIDLQGGVILFNRGAEDMTGYTADEMRGKPPLRLHVREELQSSCEALAAELGEPAGAVDPLRFFTHMAQRKQQRPIVWTYKRKDGSRLTVSQTLALLHGADGAVSGYLSMMVDISEQREAEQQLRASNARLQALLNASMEIGIIETSPNGLVRGFNTGAERLIGYTAQEVIGRSPLWMHDPDELRERQAALEQELGRPCSPFDLFLRQGRQPPGQRTRDWRYRHKDGHLVLASVSMAEIRGEGGEVLGYLAMGHDIGPQRLAEQQMREARDRLQAVLDGALEVGIVVCDHQGRIRLFNRGAENLFGYRESEILGQPTLSLQDREELERERAQLEQRLGHPVRLPEAVHHPLRSGATALSQWTFVRKDGSRFSGVLRLSRLRAGGDPNLDDYLAIVLDISAQERAQQQLEALNQELEQRVQARSQELTRTLSTLTAAQEELQRSERLAALGAMVAGVAHELNTPIGNCLTVASSLTERTAELAAALHSQQLRRSMLEAFARDAQTMADLLQRGLRNASDLVTHFKQLSVDQTSDQRRAFQLDTVVADVLTVMRPQVKHAHFRIESDVELPRLLDGYPGEMGRLLTNLIQNAQLHAFEAEQDGLMRIEARPLDDTRFLLRVSDNGKGMSAEVRRRAFDPFFTTKLGKGGSGLGLNIVFNIATGVLGGEVSLDSQPGRGACFEFRLPYEAPQRVRPGADMEAG